MSQVGDAGVVTPEAVRLEFEEASVGSRAVAILLDWMIQFGTLFVVVMGVGLMLNGVGAGLPGWVGFTVMALVVFLILFGYPIGFETLMRGRTPGKAAMGLRVVTVEGAPVGFRHAAIRAALGLVDFMLSSGFVGVVTALLSQRQQRVGDHLAGTVVVRERTGAGPATAASFVIPRGYESYAATIDPAGLRFEDYRAVRAFLLRAAELPPDRREGLARRLAATVAGRVAHRIPHGVHPEAFLHCVAARYQARGAEAGRWGEATDGGAVPGPVGAGPPPQPQRAPQSPGAEDGRVEAGGERGGFAAPS